MRSRYGRRDPSRSPRRAWRSRPADPEDLTAKAVMGAGASAAGAEASTYRDPARPVEPPSFLELARAATSERAPAAGAPGVHVVIDGMNVALANVPSYEQDPSARRAAALRGLRLCAEFFVRRASKSPSRRDEAWAERRRT